MMSQPTTNLFENEVINIHTTTVVRLLSFGADPFTLYMFYVVTAKRQSIAQNKNVNPVKSAKKYCMQGLEWGEDRFLNAKKILLENGFVEDYLDRDEAGTIRGHYIFLHYLSPSYNSYKPLPSEPSAGCDPVMGFRGTNTIDEKTNTIDTNKDTLSNPITLEQKVGQEARTSHSNDAPPEESHSNEEAITHSSKDGMYPCTEDELYKIAFDYSIPFEYVVQKHDAIMEMVESGEFAQKYQQKKTEQNRKMYYTLRGWLRLAIDRGNVQPLSDEGRMILEMQNPEERRRRREVMQKLKERNMV